MSLYLLSLFIVLVILLFYRVCLYVNIYLNVSSPVTKVESNNSSTYNCARTVIRQIHRLQPYDTSQQGPSDRRPGGDVHPSTDQHDCRKVRRARAGPASDDGRPQEAGEPLDEAAGLECQLRPTAQERAHRSHQHFRSSAFCCFVDMSLCCPHSPNWGSLPVSSSLHFTSATAAFLGHFSVPCLSPAYNMYFQKGHHFLFQRLTNHTSRIFRAQSAFVVVILPEKLSNMCMEK